MTTETPSKSSLSRRLRMGAAAIALIALSFGAGAIAVNRPSPADFAAMVPQETLTVPPLVREGLHQIAAVTTSPAAAAPRLVEPGTPFSFADLVEHVSPAVVTVVVDRETPAQQGNLDDVPAPFRDFFKQFGQPGQGQGQGQGQAPGQGQGQGRMQKSQAMGSGFIIDPAGYIVTNNHVIEDGKKITVKLPGKFGHEYTAHLVGTDKATDVALLKLDNAPSNLPTVAFGDDHHLRVGDWVVAVGNPFGLGGTVTAGIVSSIGRDIDNGPYTDYIQIDAPINQGNSGGPTFDLSGRVMGMNTAIFSPSGGSVGIGFAIPASVVKDVVTQLRDHGNVARGWLGVQIQPLTPDLAASLGTPDTMGAIVASVVDDSPAAKAGFKQGDVIISLNGGEVDDDRDLTRKVGGLRAGDHAQFLILRDGQKRPLTAVIEKRDDIKLASMEKPVGPGARPGRDNADQNAGVMTLGMEVKTLTPETRQQFNLDDKIAGVVISSVDPNSEAADKGFQPGIVIMGVNNKMVHTPHDVELAVAEAKKAGRDSVLLLVADPGEPQRYVALKIKG